MIIAVNTRLLLKNKLEGIGWFTHETLKRITRQHPEHHFIFIFDRPYSDEFIYAKNITPVVLFPPTRHYLLWYLWFEWRIPRLLKKYKADLFLSQDGWLSLRSDVPCINIIHDLNFEHYPGFIPYGYRNYYRYFFPRFAQKASRIATVSEYTKKDIVELYGIPENRIDVVYNGSNELYRPLTNEAKKIVREKYFDNCEYFIFVGIIHPRKNIENLFKAFDAFKKESANSLKLVVVGEKHWWTKEIKNTYNSMHFKHDVILTGRLQPEKLNDLIASALALLYVSFFEGFGIPILEAFNCETPVITSKVSSMPEVAGDAALLVDPNNVSDIKNAMLEIYNNPETRQNIIAKGKIQRQLFSWDNTADKLWQTIKKVM